ncbi:hypothetical protein NPIL_588971 [Nephila pilipes]|uniref:Uncharacterized protein n=1 Tax=Nephila pilipes TaxID=299642 RepID=A0A8X6JY83_NEPPI|nr:hypothetical protein NPIL_588971 [Nephila pilipes]
MDTEKIILLAWLWCGVRFAFFNTYKIVFLPTIFVLLDLTFIPSEKITPFEDDCGSSAIGFAAQGGTNINKKKKNYIQSKEKKGS